MKLFIKTDTVLVLNGTWGCPLLFLYAELQIWRNLSLYTTNKVKKSKIK
jgi:hypothetical protein